MSTKGVWVSLNILWWYVIISTSTKGVGVRHSNPKSSLYAGFPNHLQPSNPFPAHQPYQVHPLGGGGTRFCLFVIHAIPFPVPCRSKHSLIPTPQRGALLSGIMIHPAELNNPRGLNPQRGCSHTGRSGSTTPVGWLGVRGEILEPLRAPAEPRDAPDPERKHSYLLRYTPTPTPLLR
ncbi:hypothetical protein Arcpr_1169 [Archaeoglobus profundus DSM 5631]|uniref:Uncharacterized protein n=1 Tax=Archaeoglobus profundus (strain DSM 5631 / JCM 9629 / NBRC 100127 / Av18) TaxID=572546 RepID=D2RDM9_ARCPA|nr:hypothetical protein Arcpr_1169 [Archaeoglobus profundus DSM 5631]